MNTLAAKNTIFQGRHLYRRALNNARAAISTNPRALIAIQGNLGTGKSTLSRFLAWRLAGTLIELDLYMTLVDDHVEYDRECVKSIIGRAGHLNAPVIVAGLSASDVLAAAGITSDLIVIVKRRIRSAATPPTVDFDDFFETQRVPLPFQTPSSQEAPSATKRLILDFDC